MAENSTPENIKARVSFYWEGQEKPFSSVQDYNVFRILLSTSPSHDYSIPIKTINVNGKHHEVASVKLNLRKNTEDLHLTYGIDTSLSGEPLPYNLEVDVYLKR